MIKKRLGGSSWKNKGHTKKLRFLGMPPNKSAQITVFIILGLLLLFIFMMTIKLATDAKLSDLEAEKEKVISKSFKKEALRIYVEDCLNDALEDGLVLIGKQGRLWQGQPGGTKPFVEGITGVTYQPGERIFYGISNENYPPHQNAYPCKNDSYSPEFCQYQYPNTSIGFGSWEIKTSTIKGDLRQYLINRTIFCVKNFTESEISDKTKIEDTNINLKLDITNDGINVNVEYPLKLSLGKEEFFHISKFDFFYPTKFNILLDAAVARPIYYDWKFIDFDYTKDVLEQKSFTYVSNSASCEIEGDYHVCSRTLLYDKYQSLAIDMEELSLPNGDTILSFKSPEIINLPEPYEFRFAIQNRPPALDYVNHLSCILKDNPETEDNEAEFNYDYLVIPGHDDYDYIDITLNALDADGDEIVDYSFESELINDTGDDPKKFIVTDLTSLKPDIYTITATATDEHGLSDWQDIRVLVDTPLEAVMDVWYPYEVKNDQGIIVPYSKSGINSISLEDPIFVNVTYSEPVDGIYPQLKLEYLNDETSFELATLPKPNSITKPVCYNLPPTIDCFCNEKSYFSEYDFVSEESPENIFGEIGSVGKLKISASKDYCSNPLEDSTEVEVTIKECIPHVSDHPFPYLQNDDDNLYQLYNCEDESDITSCYRDVDFNPFLATHSCCDANTWEYKSEGMECYSGEEELGCFGTVEEPLEKGSILSKRVFRAYCSGDRGNICQSDADGNIFEDHENKCGSKEINSNCDKVATQCENLDPYSYELKQDGFFCDGDYGCGKEGNACTKIVVDVNNDHIIDNGDKCRSCKTDDTYNINCWDLKTGQPGNCDGASCIPIT